MNFSKDHYTYSELFTTDSFFLRNWRCVNSSDVLLLCLHGVESHSGWYEQLALSSVSHSFDVSAVDLKGWGKTLGLPGDISSYQELLDSFSQLVTNFRDRYKFIHLVGSSWGGMFCLYLFLRRGFLFDTLTLITPGLKSKKDLTLYNKFKCFYYYLLGKTHNYLPLNFLPSDFVSDPIQQRLISNDSLCCRSVTVNFCIETLKMRSFLRQQSGFRKVFFGQCFLSSDDRIIDNSLTSKISHSSNLRVDVVSDSRHSLLLEKPSFLSECIYSHHKRFLDFRRDKPFRVGIIGSGAVGCYLGSLLSLSGSEVIFFSRPFSANLINNLGLTLTVGKGTRTLRDNISALGSPSSFSCVPLDLLIIAVKSYHTEEALETWSNVFSNTRTIMSVQNGISNEFLLSQHFPHHNIIASSICAGVELLDKHVVFCSDDRGGLIGSHFYGDSSYTFKLWSDIFSYCGLSVLWGEDFSSVKWSKLILNLFFNALNSLTGLSALDLLKDDYYSTLAISAVKEGFQVMSKLGISPIDLPGYPVKKMYYLSKISNKLLRKAMLFTLKNTPYIPSSMLQDQKNHKNFSEIDQLNGLIVNYGKDLSIPTPANSEICKLLGYN